MPLRKLHGVLTPHRKNTAQKASQPIAIPKKVMIPMSMHIGAPAKPLVKPGDKVEVGQIIAQAGGFVSAPVHASVSGTVERIGTLVSAQGTLMQAVTIQADGKQTVSSSVSPPVIRDKKSFLEAVGHSGIVGLGGAGFPTAVKLNVKDSVSIEAIIINCAECEPYITSDTRTMLEDTELLRQGAELLGQYLSPGKILFAIEDNKPQCIRLLREKLGSVEKTEVLSLPARYPQGGEKVLIYHTTGRIVPEGKLPIDAGVIVLNCTTLAAIARYIKTGMPLVEKCVTVDGSAVREPKNLRVPIGTPLNELFDACGGFREEPRKVLYGGPMMGIAVPDLSVPVLKNTNAILAFGEKEAQGPKETPCIRCGRCVAHCPLGLSPVSMMNAYKQKKYAELTALKVNLCMECGCCSYICPARKPLVQYHKLAKAAEKAARQKQG